MVNVVKKKKKKKSQAFAMVPFRLAGREWKGDENIPSSRVREKEDV